MFNKKPAPIHRTRGGHARTGNAIVTRKDIHCGVMDCTSCHTQNVPRHTPSYSSSTASHPPRPTLSSSAAILIPDTNVVLHNMNVLEDSRVQNIVFLMTVLSEVQNRNKAIYARVQRVLADESKQCYVFANEHHEQTHCMATPGESVNDYKDRCIHVAAQWYARHLTPARDDPQETMLAASASSSVLSTPQVALITYDRALRDAVCASGQTRQLHNLTCQTLRDFLAAVVASDSDLLEKVQYVVPEDMKESPSTRVLFDDYLTHAALEAGLTAQTLIKGKLRVSDTSCFFGEIRGRFEGHAFERVLLAGRTNLNRAIHDDVVVVQLLPVSDWRGSTAKEPLSSGTSEAAALAAGYRAMGKVVGVLNMCRRPFCGSIDATEMQRLGIVESVAMPSDNATAVRNDSSHRPRSTESHTSSPGDETDARMSRASSGTCPLSESATTLSGVGGVRSTGRVSVLFQPKDSRIPRIRITTTHVHDLCNKRLSVVIDEWPRYSSFPVGHYVEVLGNMGDRDTEATVILRENDIPHYDFSEGVYDCLPKGEWRVTEDQVRCRLDLRDLCVVSVDPLGCRDIDDALHSRVIHDNHIEVGVHIADVTHFVHENTLIDAEAAKRATSVYLVDRRINMLPQLLTENLCSLVENEDRYAFSILWEFDEAGHVVRDWFGKTIIRSRGALYYGDAQRMIDDPHNSTDVALSLRRLMKLSRHFREQRERAGALFLASQEFKFKVDDSHLNPTDMSAYQTFEANAMIEEWMLFANAAAARRVYAYMPRAALLRRHQRPAEGAFDTLNAALQRRARVRLDDTNSLTLNQSLERCVDPNDPYFNTLIRILTTRCLRQAQYFASGEVPQDEYFHFGLAMPMYTHFTSPIRRYADVLVHRQLAAALGLRDGPSEGDGDLCVADAERMEKEARNINYRHEQAQRAGRDSQNLFTGFYLRRFVDSQVPDEDGYVVRHTDSHVFVLVPRYGQESKIARAELARVPELLDRVKVQITVRRRRGDSLDTRLSFAIRDCMRAEEGDGDELVAEEDAIDDVRAVSAKPTSTVGAGEHAGINARGTVSDGVVEQEGGSKRAREEDERGEETRGA